MTISTKKAQLDDIVKIISEFSQRSDLRRFDDNAGGLSVIMFTEFKKYEALKNCTDALKKLDQEIRNKFYILQNSRIMFNEYQSRNKGQC